MKKKIVFLVILIIIIILVVLFLWRLVLINKIKDLNGESIKISNLYFIEEDGSSITEFWKKDNIIKENTKLMLENNNLTFWNNFDTEESYTLFNNIKKYSMGTNGMIYEPQANNVEILDSNNSILLALNPMFKIKTEQYDGKICYYIKLGQDEVYIDKEYGITLYQKSENNELKVKYSINSVKDEDVAKPDLTNYTNN